MLQRNLYHDVSLWQVGRALFKYVLFLWYQLLNEICTKKDYP